MLRIIRNNGALALIKLINRGLRRISSLGHKIQFLMEWGVRPHPEWFDHFIDQHYKWTATRNPLGWERGIFNLLVIQPGAKVLELCCGDGFNAYHFYSIRAKSILSVDFDPNAIKHAKSNFRCDNIAFQALDIRNELPQGPFDNILWDGAIEHFTEKEIDSILANIKSSLTENGVLSGYTIIESDTGEEYHHEHEHEFKGREDLTNFLAPHFKYVEVWETHYPDRKNLYFFAADSPIKLPHTSH